MLPKADCAFNIPNLNDDLELNCRLYFPKPSSKTSDVSIQGFAIFAHPYAPLGGSYDDPMVQTVGGILLRHSFVLCTFNFRGAAGSPGSTSWTGKAELADYVSIYTFMLHLINNTELMGYVSLLDDKPLLLLGGYSYGSMIASHLPDIQSIQRESQANQLDSTDYEIWLKAEEITKVLLGYLEMQLHRGRASGRAEDNMNSMRGVMMGGLDADTANRRASRESSRRSADIGRVRHSIDRVRSKFHHKTNTNNEIQQNDHHTSPVRSEGTFFVEPRIAYLLVSPILQLVAGFTTVFSKLAFERKNTPPVQPSKSVLQNLTENPTLAVYGNKDAFTSSRRLKGWSQELQSVPNSQFLTEEVVNAGHFWQEHEALRNLRTAVEAWLTTITYTKTQNEAMH